MSNGYIKIWRKIKLHDFWQDKRVFSRFEAWVDLMMLAVGIDKSLFFRDESIEVKRGSLVTSERILGERWKWGRKKVRIFLNFCSKERMINVQKRAHRYTYITILNYRRYNPPRTTEDTTEEPQRNHRGTRTNKGEEKRIKENVSISYDILVESWNNFAQIGINKRSTRESHLKARLKEKRFSFDGLLKKIEGQPFLLGKNKNGWKATFDWILLPSNYQKIIEESYKSDKFSGIRGFYEEEKKRRNDETRGS